MMVCIGKPAYGLFKKWRELPGCGEKWDRDFPDGRCPICRGYLIPESMAGPQHKIMRPDPDAIDAAAVRQGTVTQLIRDDEVWLGQMLIEVFGPAGDIPDSPELIVKRLEAVYTGVHFAPTLRCWVGAAALFDAHMDDEAREIVESIDPETE